MKKHITQFFIPLTLISSSLFFYAIHYIIFKDMHHIFLYLIGDIAFIPLEVLLVTVIIHKILNDREKQRALEKMNMILGVFFSEAGKKMLKTFIDADAVIKVKLTDLKIHPDMTDKNIKNIQYTLKKVNWHTEIEHIKIVELAEFLLLKRDFFMKLLENPVLLEHNIFTDLMQSLFHLEDEFTQRMDARNMSAADIQHIQIDINRTYNYLLEIWIMYMRYLRNTHPYLFAFATKTNPLAQI